MIEKKLTHTSHFPLWLPSYKNIAIAISIAALLLLPDVILEFCTILLNLIFDGIAFVLYQVIHNFLGFSRQQSDIYVGYIFLEWVSFL